MSRGRGGDSIPERRRDPSLEDIFAQMSDLASSQPPWWTPPDAYTIAANQFSRISGVDSAVAQRILKHRYKTYEERMQWYKPDLSMLVSPEDTVVGMNDAAQTLMTTARNGEKIAIFGDYDPDGTTGVSAMRLALAPYVDDKNILVAFADAKRGFGLTNQFVQDANDWGAHVLMTIDCGSTQTSQVKLAQSLGMRVIIVDHHLVDPENPAEHHLNPLLYHADGEPEPTNTGAQLAWKLGLALHQAAGDVPEDYYGRAMYLAQFGCRADMGNVVEPENRMFFWYPVDTYGADVVPPGLMELSRRLEEDPTDPGNVVMTSACLNLPKRSSLVSADDAAAILSAKTLEEALPYVDRLYEAYEKARPVKKEMIQSALDQIKKRKKGGYTTHAVLDDHSDYAGYTGSVAQAVSRQVGKPAIVFAARGEDEHGQEVYKFSIRNSANRKHKVGELIEDAAMRKACELVVTDETGESGIAASIGGHAEVVSGACTKDNIHEVKRQFETWANKKAGSSGKGWVKRASSFEAYVTERLVDPSRLPQIEKDAKRLGPYGQNESHYELQISMMGKITQPEINDDGYYRMQIHFPNGLVREAITGEKTVDSLPVDQDAEWVLNVGTGPYYIGKFHLPKAT
jgi:single-stranded DNA-specific DHH superfamily exonuclease